MLNDLKYKILLIILLSFFVNLRSIEANPNIEARTAILMDYDSNEILYELDPDHEIYPASMTKIMTSIIVFDLLQKNKISLEDKIIISEKAWHMSQSGYSSMFIMPNDEVSIEDLLKGIIIASGNDACVALAEGVAGTEENFVDIMNEKAEEIGMFNTNFSNTSGITDPNNYSTVRDIALMSKYLIKNYPEFYEYYKETTFTWDRTGGDPITQGNRNPLLYKNIGVDGIKTGFLTVEKYSLASTMKIGERRIIAVGSGFQTKNSRSRESIKLLNYGIRRFDTIQVALKNEPMASLNVWLGKKNKVDVVVSEDIYFTVPKRKKNIIKAIIEYNGPIKAPIKKGEIIGKLNVYVLDELTKEIDLLSNEDIKRANVFSRLLKSINYLIWGDV